MVCIDMAKYFEARNQNNEAVIIDDAYRNIELSNVYNLSLFSKKYVNGATSYIHTVETVNDDVLWGIGLKELAGRSIIFSVFSNNKTIELHFRNKENGTVSCPADDIMRFGKLYSFAYRSREPTQHMTGLEVYDDHGRVVYSSDANYLRVLSCGGHENVSIPVSDRAIAFTLGDDFIHNLYVYSGAVRGDVVAEAPKFTVMENSISVSEQQLRYSYSSDFGPGIGLREIYCYGGKSYGWMIGEIL